MHSLPLSLYIHIPWCVKKCPYCDFNSHTLKTSIDFKQYCDHLIADFAHDLRYITDKKLHSIFIGGGTPSLFSSEYIHYLLQNINDLIEFEQDIEITIESNPNSADLSHFNGYVDAGINRISIGVQSFDDDKLNRLGRVHNKNDAIKAISLLNHLPLNSFNLDLMHGLPSQTLDDALQDLTTAISFNPAHLSWYQLTIEPQTLFSSMPPTLPDDELLWEIYQQGNQLLKNAGYEQYETSAYARDSKQCKHNLNYWRFGDYLGIGCGAHSKLTLKNKQIIRLEKTKSPVSYAKNYLFKQHQVQNEELPFEFFMNQLRLFEAAPKSRFSERTNCNLNMIEPQINQAISSGYLTDDEHFWYLTEKGKLFLNSLLSLFLV